MTGGGQSGRGAVTGGRTEGVVFNVMRFAVHDGPGIRTTAFLKGCPLSCWWCHNPEGQRPEPEIVFRPERCLGCGRCLEVCPTGAAQAAPPAGDARCTVCGRCADVCPAGAREVCGRTVSAAELVDEICRDRVFYEQSGGGVTFSGGEPLAQPDFLGALLRLCRGRGLHTCVDTSGWAAESTLLEIARDVDIFLYDLKLMDTQRHRRYTGVGNEQVLRNLKALLEAQRAVTVRIPLVPGINDDAENLSATGRFLSSLQGPPEVVLLPYHPTGEHKYLRLERTYRAAGTAAPGPDELTEAARRLRDWQLKVRIGG